MNSGGKRPNKCYCCGSAQAFNETPTCRDFYGRGDIFCSFSQFVYLWSRSGFPYVGRYLMRCEEQDAVSDTTYSNSFGAEISVVIMMQERRAVVSDPIDSQIYRAQQMLFEIRSTRPCCKILSPRVALGLMCWVDTLSQLGIVMVTVEFKVPVLAVGRKPC